jgi:ABC-type branched-subunit amino acid transport system ATPase component
MAHRPRVLLLDEPSAGIAQRESEAMGELILGLSAETGASFIIIEHDVPLVSYVSDRLICLHLGEIIAEGQTTDVLGNPDVISAYLGRDDVTINRSRTSTPA